MVNLSEFEFSTDDLIADDPTPFKREQTKQFPIPGQPVRTSASAAAQRTHDMDSPAQLSTLSAGELMMGVPLYGDESSIVGNQEYLMSNLLGAATTSDKDGLGVFNAITPPDIKNASDFAAIQRQGASTGDTTSTDGTGGQPGTGGIDPAASTDGQRLVSSPNVQFQATAGGTMARDDITAGRIAPNIIFAASVLAAHMGFTISCGASDLSGHRGQGHAPGSLHYQFKAIDIVDLVDTKTGQSVHIANDRNNPLIRQALDILNTITGPRRPDQVISLISTGYPGFFSQADHWNHIHLGTHTWGDPAPPPAGTAKVS